MASLADETEEGGGAAEIPADFAGKLITTSTSLHDPLEQRDALKPRRIVQEKTSRTSSTETLPVASGRLPPRSG